ncbi:MAG: GlsB/YeaQ/YmgE family stress response membrane protein [Acidobacteriota bacterium]|nr:GlsB/YeaQ/YmgE family stress response membrane protein [Acidobacteriota bacterium]NLH69159.1 GlsB/YeaQ/YmgE family stress response membrane protein [Brooklawnia sp.]
MMFISWLVLGLIAGMIAKAVVGGGGGWLVTVLLGVLGAVVGGWISSLLFGISLRGFWNPITWIIAILGGFLVTFVYNKVTKKS